MAKNYWLVKSEEEEYPLSRLQNEPEQKVAWDGIRNYQARNFMRDEMKVGDEILYYHSRCDEPGIVGLAQVVSEPYPDPTQFDKKSKYYDEKSTPDNPRWMLREFGYLKTFTRRITLAELKADPALSDMLVVKKGQRLSIQPVEKAHFSYLSKLASQKK